MVSVRRRMADGQSDGHGDPAAALPVSSEGDDGEEIGGAPILEGGVGGITAPGDAGDAEEIPGLPGLGLDPAAVPVALHVLRHVAVEGMEVPAEVQRSEKV